MTTPSERITDFMEIAYAPTAGKRTQTFNANLAKGGAILPYLRDGRIVWMYKDPAHWLTADVVQQFDNLVLTHGHEPHEYSHDYAIGMVRDTYLQEEFISGTIAVFKPAALNAIDDGIIQLSPDAMVRLEPIGREIDGRWVDFAQTFPMLDHIALVDKGRHGAELALSRASDRADPSNGFLGLSLSDAQQFIEIIVKDEHMNELEKAQAALAEATTELGRATAEKQQVSDERDTALALVAELQTQLAAVPTQDQAQLMALEAIALFDAARHVVADASFTLENCIKDKTGMLRLVQKTLAPTLTTISDEMLPAFCAGLLTVAPKTVAETPATEPASQTVESVSDAGTSVFTSIVTPQGQTQTVTEHVSDASAPETAPAQPPNASINRNPFAKLYDPRGLLA